MLAPPVCGHPQLNSTKWSTDQFSFDVSRIILPRPTVKVYRPYRESCATRYSQWNLYWSCCRLYAPKFYKRFLKNLLNVFKKSGHERHKHFVTSLWWFVQVFFQFFWLEGKLEITHNYKNVKDDKIKSKTFFHRVPGYKDTWHCTTNKPINK